MSASSASVCSLPWWEREKMLTPKDKEAIAEGLDEDCAETEAGRYELRSIKMRKYHDEEYSAGML